MFKHKIVCYILILMFKNKVVFILLLGGSYVHH